MRDLEVDITIIGAGPVGLMCAYLAQQCGLKTAIIDKSSGPLKVGRADALNARTLQLLEIVDLFKDIYPLGKPCDTSSIWENGEFISRESSWWKELEGCFHKHFLMIGQSYIEQKLDKALINPVMRNSEVLDISIEGNHCITELSNGRKIVSKYLIGSDGSRSFVRNHFNINFEIKRPEITWAVIDGIIETDFPKVPEIIVFQNETSDVAWIPREGKIDRFYIRMDQKKFEMDEAITKIEKSLLPHSIKFKEIEWSSQFSVKESVADKFDFENRVFLAGDSCHIHSVNGGQGLNTGLGDAFNLIWKINMVVKKYASRKMLSTYENERKPVAHSVIDSSGELVRSTKFSKNETHAKDYLEIIKKRSGNITGMGIRYGECDGKNNIEGSRLHDFKVSSGEKTFRIYELLDYSKFTLLVFGDQEIEDQKECVQVIRINSNRSDLKSFDSPYGNQSILIRPDSYIESIKNANWE